MKDFPDMDFRPGRMSPLPDNDVTGAMRFCQAVRMAAEYLGATPADVAGLWIVPDYPELTSGQLLQLAQERSKPLGA